MLKHKPATNITTPICVHYRVRSESDAVRTKSHKWIIPVVLITFAHQVTDHVFIF